MMEKIFGHRLTQTDTNFNLSQPPSPDAMAGQGVHRATAILKLEVIGFA
jgi:hypothetical protein